MFITAVKNAVIVFFV